MRRSKRGKEKYRVDSVGTLPALAGRRPTSVHADKGSRDHSQGVRKPGGWVCMVRKMHTGSSCREADQLSLAVIRGLYCYEGREIETQDGKGHCLKGTEGPH